MPLNGDEKMSGVNREKESNYLLHVLAYNLLSIRSQRNLSQEDLEDLTGVSVNEISKIERELTKPRLDILAALAKGLEIDDLTVMRLFFCLHPSRCSRAAERMNNENP